MIGARRTQTLVIGAGQAGLALSRHLTAAGHPHVVLDRGRIGERWRSERWESLALLTPNWLNRLPGSPPHADAHGFLTREELVGYLDAYARSFAAPVREHVTVRSVERAGRRFRVQTDRRNWLAENVVIATGDADLPHLPPVAAAVPAGIERLHSSAYRSPERLPPGGVLVVGAGPSGQQLALELRRSGRHVVLAAGRHARLPRTYRGRDIFEWLEALGELDRTVDELPDPAAARRGQSVPLSGRGGGEPLDLAVLQAAGVTLAGRLRASTARPRSSRTTSRRTSSRQRDACAGSSSGSTPSAWTPRRPRRSRRSFSLRRSRRSTCGWPASPRRSSRPATGVPIRGFTLRRSTATESSTTGTEPPGSRGSTASVSASSAPGSRTSSEVSATTPPWSPPGSRASRAHRSPVVAFGRRAMEFRLLGPVEAGDRGVGLPLGGGKQRALLALLLLNADRVVPVERIVDGLWGDEVPETAVKGVQIYVSRLRKVLPAGRLETKAPGYVLHVEPGELDLARFEDLLTKGREALAAERPAEAARALRDGLGLWRGPALAEFEEPFATPEAARLEELRLTCLELRLEADLALGRHQELAGELESLVTRYPLREGLRAQQLLALYRAGRQAEALHAYQEFRRQLDEELGIEPSQRLRELERRMLQQDPALDTRAAGAHARPESPAVAPAPAEAPRRGTIVGREAELSRLRRLYAESLDGHRQVVFVTGPAGIGKTTLLRSFLAEAEASGALVAHGQCLEQFGAGEAYMPLLEALERLCNGSSAGQLSSLLAERAPAWLEQMPSLRGHLPAASVSAHVNGRPQMLRELSSALEAISAIQPLVVALEDLHWSDPSTVDALNAIARRADPARLLLLATYRPQDARSHPVATLATELMTRGLASDVRLGTLTRRAVVDYLEGRFPAGELPLELGELLHERTTGNPLFLENVVDAWVAGGAIVRVGERWTLRGTVAELSVDVPGTVRQLIESQLDRLDEADQRLVEVASVAGAEFTSAMVASACEQDDLEVEGRLTELAAGGQFVESLGELELTGGAVSARFGFVHALFAEIAYARLSPGRRTRLHRAIGSAIEATSGGGAVPAAELALHFSLGHNPERAIVYFRVAAEQSLARSGHREAVEHLTAALAALDELPAGPDRATAEIPLRIALGSAFMEARGYAAPEVRAAYTRARELCRELGDTEHLKSVLFGLSTIAEVAGDYRDAHALARELLELGEAEGSDEVVASARIALGWPLICMGRFAEARGALEPIADASGSDRMLGAVALVDPAVERLSLLAWTEWFLGRPDKAVSRSTAAVELALEFAPFRRAYALTCDALLRVLRRERAAAADRAEQALALAAEHELPLWSAWATIVAGWASTKNGAHRIELIQSGLEAATATGSSWARTYFLAVLAEVCLEEAQVELGRSTLDGALALAESGDEQFAVPELLRLRAELGLASGATAEAEADLARALEVARGQGARSPELRAAVSLARLQQASGRTGDARLVLSRAYGWFTEGFDTPDLRAAAALLDELGGPLELEQDGVSGTRIVGRESELTQLADRLGQASAGSRRLVFVHGDAGIGKTTLVEALLESVGDDVVVARGQCIEHRGAGEPYLPLLEALGRLGRRPAVKETLARFAPTWLAQLPALLEPDELDTLNARIIGATRERMLRELVDALDELAREQTLVLVLEDLHWADYSTLDLLEALARRNEPARLLVIGTHRPPARSEELQPVGGSHASCASAGSPGSSRSGRSRRPRSTSTSICACPGAMLLPCSARGSAS